MGDGGGLLAAVCAEPADDLPRLILADWLEENGDPDRAEFIRLQIEHRTVLTGSDVTETIHRDFALLERNGRQWVRSVGESVGLTRYYCDHGHFGGTGFGGPVGFIWSRGFVTGVRISTGLWSAREPVLRKVTPIDTVHVTDWPEVSVMHRRANDDLLVSVRFGPHEARRDIAMSAARHDPQGAVRYWAEQLAGDLYSARWPGVTFKFGELPERAAAWLPPRPGVRSSLRQL